MPTVDVDQLLSGKSGRNSQPLLSRRIEFKESFRPDTKMDMLRKKYRSINDPGVLQAQTKKTAAAAAQTAAPMARTYVDPVSGFRRPTHTLFPKEGLSLAWELIRPIGPGLQNLGNTCFLNSVLQCLTYTPPLANYLLAQGHTTGCRTSGFCMLCELERHITRCFDTGQKSAICPKLIVSRLKLIAKHMRLGRQEDSHEFLRYVIDAMQNACLRSYDAKMDSRIKETSFVHGVFGGYLQSQIKCSVCHADSNTFDPFLDLSLEIRHCSSLQRALQVFTKPDVLNGKNQYRCERCKRLVDAKKQMTIYQSPEVLTIQLKRFSYEHSMFGSKLSKPIEYPEMLDLSPYISASQKASERHCQYRLYGVLVHSGSTCHSGHYYCYVKASSGVWYCMDDNMVSQASLSTVLSRSAYLLFYVRVPPKTKAKPCQSPTPVRSKSVPTTPTHSNGTAKATPDRNSQPASAQPTRTLVTVSEKTAPTIPLVNGTAIAPNGSPSTKVMSMANSKHLPSTLLPVVHKAKSVPSCRSPSPPADALAVPIDSTELKSAAALALVSTSHWNTSPLVPNRASPSPSAAEPTKSPIQLRRTLSAHIRRKDVTAPWSVQELTATGESLPSPAKRAVTSDPESKASPAPVRTTRPRTKRRVISVAWDDSRHVKREKLASESDTTATRPWQPMAPQVKSWLDGEDNDSDHGPQDESSAHACGGSLRRRQKQLETKRGELFHQLQQSRPKPRPLDQWDQALDRGRTKKMNRKLDPFTGGNNKFQLQQEFNEDVKKLQTQQRHGGKSRKPHF
ncbi:hypothetical protein H4R34_002923 [Dimargaris verticillata]|uniref:Ubiquitin carboxyl-terminal hydrolase n=1 Tax=Dimargaris verticillata TaxID=2761393 RepID=A0A9W8B5K8_9FUNG|nr:hypothetical protein H4R34_002923 [Dimargaris verticillata]